MTGCDRIDCRRITLPVGFESIPGQCGQLILSSPPRSCATIRIRKSGGRAHRFDPVQTNQFSSNTQSPSAQPMAVHDVLAARLACSRTRVRRRSRRQSSIVSNATPAGKQRNGGSALVIYPERADCRLSSPCSFVLRRPRGRLKREDLSRLRENSMLRCASWSYVCCRTPGSMFSQERPWPAQYKSSRVKPTFDGRQRGWNRTGSSYPDWRHAESPAESHGCRTRSASRFRRQGGRRPGR